MPIGSGFTLARSKLKVVHLPCSVLELFEREGSQPSLRVTDRQAAAREKDNHPKNLVQCCVCKDVHWVQQRKRHNGTYSECPECGHDVFTYP